MRSSLCTPHSRRQGGFSLIEVVISIVILAIALTGIMSTITYANRYSGDPLIREQAVTLAQTMMEEVMLRDFTEPGYTGSCPPNDGNYDNICDYNGYTKTPAPPLDGYTITVNVTNGDHLGVTGDVKRDILGANSDVLRIDVTVTHSSGESVTLSAYRTKY